MALSAAQTSQLYEVFGLPQGGLGYDAAQVANLWGPAGEAYDFTAHVTALTTKLAALSASQETRVTTALTRWDVITSYDPLKIHRSTTGGEGTIVDYPAEREAIRQTIGNVIGYYVPRGGFVAEIQRAAGGKSTGISR